MPRPPLPRSVLSVLALALLAALVACGAPPAGLPPLPSPTATFAASTADELVVLIEQRLVVVAPGGQQHEVAKTTGTAVYPAEPRWSPDGTRIAFIRRQFYDGRAESDYGDDVLVVSSSGGASEEVHHHVVRGQQASGLTWTADGSALLFGLFEPTVTNGVIQSYMPHVVHLDLATRAERTLLENAFSPSLSRDGRTMVYAIPDHGLNVADADGQYVRPLVPPGLYPGLSYPRIAPDGSTVVFSSAEPLTTTRALDPPSLLDAFVAWFAPRRAEAHGVPMDLWRVEVASGTRARVTNIGADDPYPSWSADGRAVLFLATGGLYRVEPDGTHLEQIGPGVTLGQVDARAKR